MKRPQGGTSNSGLGLGVVEVGEGVLEDVLSWSSVG